jgi:hypothetical protein
MYDTKAVIRYQRGGIAISLSVMKDKAKAKVGIMACGHREYWPQFSGVKEEILKGAPDREHPYKRLFRPGNSQVY